MLAPVPSTAYNWAFDNWVSTPATQFGTSVTPGASNVEGSWTQIASSANIANQVHWFWLRVSNGGVSAIAKNLVLDVGVDPAGGTSYTAVVTDWICGSSNTATLAACPLLCLPLRIPAGASVAVRAQTSDATGNAVNVQARFYGRPSDPVQMPLGHYAETVGAVTNSVGVSFTPGNAADGSWASLGTTVKDLWWLQLGWQINNAGMSSHSTYIELAAGTSTNRQIIRRVMAASSSTELLGSVTSDNAMWPECYRPLPAGTELWIRARNSAAPVTGYNANVIGVGG